MKREQFLWSDSKIPCCITNANLSFCHLESPLLLLFRFLLSISVYDIGQEQILYCQQYIQFNFVYESEDYLQSRNSYLSGC